jgi:hypothetical protein
MNSPPDENAARFDQSRLRRREAGDKTDPSRRGKKRSWDK